MRTIPAGLALLFTLTAAAAAQQVGLVAESSGRDLAALLNKPTGLAVDAAGRVAVLDGGDRKVRVFDSRGKLLYAFGRQGQGPGEFTWPTSIRAIGTGWQVVDATSLRILRFLPDGKPQDMVQLEPIGGVALAEVLPMKNGWSIARTVFRVSLGQYKHDPVLVAISPKRSLDTLAASPTSVGVWHLPNKGVPWGVLTLSWLGVGATAAVSGDTLAMVADGRVGSARFLRLTDKGLVPVRTVSLGVKATPVPQAMLDRATDSVRNDVKDRTAVIDVPKTASAITGESTFADDGTAWLELRTETGPRTWLKINPSTGAQQRIQLPRGFSLKAVRGDLLYGFWKDAMDVQSLRIYRLL